MASDFRFVFWVNQKRNRRGCGCPQTDSRHSWAGGARVAGWGGRGVPMAGCSSCMAACRKPVKMRREANLWEMIRLIFLLLTLPASCTPQVPGSTGQQQQGTVSGWMPHTAVPLPCGQASRRLWGASRDAEGHCPIRLESSLAQPFAGSQGAFVAPIPGSPREQSPSYYSSS